MEDEQRLFTSVVLLIASTVATSLDSDLPKPQSLGFPTDLGLGDEAVVTCFAKKSSLLSANQLSLSWHKDGAPISSEARISLARLSRNSLSLSIKSVLPEDIGNYTCVAEGPTGSSTVTVPLLVSGALVISWLFHITVGIQRSFVHINYN
ncbi:hemicentin-2 [Ixodes scapularis]|uniref:hemicentin-2 n=1 Tax=Ixodes scapularis TaxID=6945 RepID=UPI001AA00748|nr:hemicentin-2 [Ixodes scapularis]